MAVTIAFCPVGHEEQNKSILKESLVFACLKGRGVVSVTGVQISLGLAKID